MRALSIVGALWLVGCGDAGSTADTDTETDAGSSGGPSTAGTTSSGVTGSGTVGTTDGADSSGGDVRSRIRTTEDWSLG